MIMAYKKRLDNRKHNEMRKMSAEVGVVKNAVGSARFQIGKTSAYAAVYGPREMIPRFLKDSSKGVLRCNYSMMPFSGMGNRVRPGINRRAVEISSITTDAILPVMNLDKYPNVGVDVFIELDQTDAGSRCAGITAAALALADAGIEMKDLVSSVAVGYVDGDVVVDLSYEEEAYDKGPVADIPVAIIPSTGEITLLQMDGEVPPEAIKKALSMAKEAVKEIYKVQKTALKKKYE